MIDMIDQWTEWGTPLFFNAQKSDTSMNLTPRDPHFLLVIRWFFPPGPSVEEVGRQCGSTVEHRRANLGPEPLKTGELTSNPRGHREHVDKIGMSRG